MINRSEFKETTTSCAERCMVVHVESLHGMCAIGHYEGVYASRSMTVRSIDEAYAASDAKDARPPTRHQD